MDYSAFTLVLLIVYNFIQPFLLYSTANSITLISNNHENLILNPIRQLLLQEYYSRNHNLSLRFETKTQAQQNSWPIFYRNLRKQRKRDLIETDSRTSTFRSNEAESTNWESLTSSPATTTTTQIQHETFTTEMPTIITSTMTILSTEQETQYSIINSDQKTDKSTTLMPLEQSPLVQKVPLRDPCDNQTMLCFGEFVECRFGFCKCIEGYVPRPDNRDVCGERTYYNVEIPQTDPTMIGVVIGLALMSVTLCVVLRLFAKARFRENRTIFNTPNPRLMNVSLMKGHRKLFRANSNTVESSKNRRDSQISVSSTATDKRGRKASAVGSSTRPKPTKQLSTETTTTFGGTPDSPSVIKLPPGVEQINRNKYGAFRQDSVKSSNSLA